MRFYQFTIAFVLECRYQRERLAAPSPWEDTPENRRDWFRDVILDFVELLNHTDEPLDSDRWHSRTQKVAGTQPEGGDNDCG